MAEKDTLKAILDYLRLRGHLCKRNQSGMMIDRRKQKTYAIRMGEPGWPDIIGLDSKGRFFGIEVKFGNNKPTADQETILKEIAARGGLAILAYDVDDVIKAGL